VLAQDMLFATLDPTMRQISLPGLDKAILSDTVGFVSDLPTQLIAAFRATLEEVLSADLILHVRDIAHPDTEAQKADVLDVLSDLGAITDTEGDGEGDETASRPIIEIWNKLDLIEDPAHIAAVKARAERESNVVLISALTGEGLPELKRYLADNLERGHRRYELTLDGSSGAALAWLHAHGEILSEDHENMGDLLRTHVSVRMAPADYERFLRMHDKAIVDD